MKTTQRCLATAAFLVCASIRGADPLGAASAPAAIRASASGGPWIHFADAVAAVAGDETADTLAPRSLATADFDGDGMPDLAVGYATPSGGLVRIFRGDVDFLFPNSPGAKSRRAAGESIATPFQAVAAEIELPMAPDFLGAGDFDADGHADLAVAARGGTTLGFVRGRGGFLFGALETRRLAGGATAMAVADLDRRSGLPGVAVAVDGGRSGASLAFFVSERGALGADPESVALPEVAAALAAGDFDEDGLPDLAVAAGADVLLHMGRGLAGGALRLESMGGLAIGSPIVGMASGDFLVPTDSHFPAQLAALDAAGVVHVVEIERERGAAPRLARHETYATAIDGAAAGAGAAAALVGARISSVPRAQAIVLDRAGRTLTAVSPEIDARAGAAERLVSFATSAAPVAVLPMRLNKDALSDLVVLLDGEAEPLVLLSQPASIYVVTSTASDNDCNTADNVCSTDNGGGCGSGPCTYTAALQQANAHAGADEIDFHFTGTPPFLVNGQGPQITDAITIDGSTDPQYAGAPDIYIVANGHDFLMGAGGNYSIRDLGGHESGCATCSDGVWVANGMSGAFVEGMVIGPGDGFGAPGYATALDAPGGSSNITFGGTAAGAGNRIIGDANTLRFTDLRGAGHVVQGNVFGFDLAGNPTLTVQVPIYSLGSVNLTFGGASAGARNVVSGTSNPGDAAFYSTSSITGALIQGNFFGTSIDGSAGAGNAGEGVAIDTGFSNSTLGGSAAGAGNVISGSAQEGVRIYTTLDLGNGSAIEGNLIGVAADGTTPLPNGGRAGLWLNTENFSGSVGVAVGGAAPGAGNVIANSPGDGLEIGGGWYNAVRGNSIYDNGGLGVELCTFDGCSGTLANDFGDADGTSSHGQANQLQNYPLVAAAAGTAVAGWVETVPATAYSVDFYASPNCDPTGFGEGKLYLGATSFTTDSLGCAAFSVTGLSASIPAGWFVTSIATDVAGNSSSFSLCFDTAGSIFIDGFEGDSTGAWSVTHP